MTEEERQRAIRLRLARSSARTTAFIPTGYGSLDSALGGGLPRGRITELFGEPATGKTTMALEIVARAQAAGLSVAWIDAERAFNAAYAAGHGVILEHLPLAQPDFAEQALEIARRLANSGGIEFLVIDSAAALTPALEFEVGLGEAGQGLQSRVLSSGFHRLAFAAARTETAILVLNQIRSRTGASGASEEETTAGGPALKLHAAVRISLEYAGEPASKRFRVLKGKMAAAFGEGEVSSESGAKH